MKGFPKRVTLRTCRDNKGLTSCCQSRRWYFPLGAWHLGVSVAICLSSFLHTLLPLVPVSWCFLCPLVTHLPLLEVLASHSLAGWSGVGLMLMIRRLKIISDLSSFGWRLNCIIPLACLCKKTFCQ